MRYADNIDYLVASIMYLGIHSYYWARSPKSLATELSLNEDRLTRVFLRFPGIYRQSAKMAPNGGRFYSLQARYAQKEGADTEDPEQVSYIAPLDKDKLQLLLTFVLQSAEAERTGRRAWVSNTISITAAITAAIAAVIAALLRA